MENCILNINPQAVEICRLLQINGYQAYIVGGCVRDLLMNNIPKDWDIATSATPEQVIALFLKTYPTGLQHGTVTVAMGEGIKNHFEVTTFRTEGQYLDGRRPENVTFVSSIEEDLSRRDLTINAIAYDPIRNILKDPFNGQLDIAKGIIQTVGDSNLRFQEDGLRIMRAVRFAARFNYQITQNTLNGMKNNLDNLQKVSKERIKDELCKILMTEHPKHGLFLLLECEILPIVAPYLMSNPIHYQYIINHDYCKGELETRIAFLYFACLNEKEIQKELINLKFSNKEIKTILFLLKLVGDFSVLLEHGDSLAYKSFIAVLKNHSPDPWERTLEEFIELMEASGLRPRELLDKYKDTVVFSRKELKINGNDLINLGFSIGPKIKEILDECYLEILAHPEHNNEIFLFQLVSGNWKIINNEIIN